MPLIVKFVQIIYAVDNEQNWGYVGSRINYFFMKHNYIIVTILDSDRIDECIDFNEGFFVFCVCMCTLLIVVKIFRSSILWLVFGLALVGILSKSQNWKFPVFLKIIRKNKITVEMCFFFCLTQKQITVNILHFH